MLTQEDFNSATSVRPDVVKMTDAKLDPMLAEGGELPGQEQVPRTNKRITPFLLSQDIKLNNPRVRTRFEDGLFQRQKHN